MSVGLRKSPNKSKNEVFAICPERTKRVSPIGGEKKYYFLFLVLTLTCRHSQKLKLTSEIPVSFV